MAWERPGSFQGLDMGELRLDEAFLQVIYNGAKPAQVYSLSSNCHGCPWQRMDDVVVNSTQQNITFTMHTHPPVSLLVTVSTRQVPGELRVGSHAGLDGESELTSSVISVKL